ncbi:hypothetical protein Q0M94_11310 [Deinococcus radiomollis]|uniref:hypothetical protein n=1 Tax=Deinococcus radiomollis TaxID=468916 RepID=UPI003891AD66
MAKKNRQPSAPQEVYVDLMLMPGTKVLFWAVAECPYCEARHYHPAGTERGDPGERLGEVQAPCGNGPYILALQPRPLRKKGKKGKRRDSWDDFDE